MVCFLSWVVFIVLMIAQKKCSSASAAYKYEPIIIKL